MNRIYISDLICASDSYEETINFLEENKIKT